ncbi:MAG TPA: Crp/Fnr family transcriptional regulator [Methylomirabilota bacterium]|nr:Crp/Fnr family transcriptional regulator [Methylomirabilota bacterium]
MARTHSNRLIAALPAAHRKRLLKALEPVSLTLRQPLYEAGDPIKFVYFPLSGVHSIVSTVADSGIVEVATVGNEGMVGIPVFLGGRSTPDEAFCHVPGSALRMRAPRFREQVRRSRALRAVMLRYTQAFIHQIEQHAACNRLHSVAERCASWLLMTHDRVSADEFPLTQESLAQMLGVRRATVTTAAGMLQRAGLIRYTRGRIAIVDRKKLKRASCVCYRIIRQEYRRLLG